MEMAKQPTVSSCASNRSSLGLAATAVFLLLFGGFFVLRVKPDNWDLPFARVFGYEVRGVTYNRLTGERLGDSYIDCGNHKSTSDVRGHFVIDLDSPESKRCTVTAPGFDPQNIETHPGNSLVVRLAPGPTWMIAQIVEWGEKGRFDKQYDLLHPDVSRSWTREEFSRLLTLTENHPIISFEQAEPHFLKQWNNYGELYVDVAVVPAWITFDRYGQHVRYYWEAHWVQEGDFWRWFREPLIEISTVDVTAEMEGSVADRHRQMVN